MHPPVYVSVKSYGDLVIAVSVLERAAAEASRYPEIVFGSHLSDLMSGLGTSIPYRCIPLRTSAVPAFYDVRKEGPVAALRSARELRRGFCKLPTRGPLVFDRMGLREHFISAPVKAEALPSAPNIYEAYAASLASYGFKLQSRIESAPNNAGPIGIFPASRLARKNIPLPLIERLVHSLAEMGLSPRVYLLQGERLDVQASALPYKVLPRTFDSLIELVSSCRGIISADSLPAHLAERANIPVFVLSPVANTYWLPRTSFERDAWALFEAPNIEMLLDPVIRLRPG